LAWEPRGSASPKKSHPKGSSRFGVPYGNLKEACGGSIIAWFSRIVDVV